MAFYQIRCYATDMEEDNQEIVGFHVSSETKVHEWLKLMDVVVYEMLASRNTNGAPAFGGNVHFTCEEVDDPGYDITVYTKPEWFDPELFIQGIRSAITSP